MQNIESNLVQGVAGAVHYSSQDLCLKYEQRVVTCNYKKVFRTDAMKMSIMNTHLENADLICE